MKRIKELLAKFADLTPAELSELSALMAEQTTDEQKAELAKLVVTLDADVLEAVATAQRARADEILDGETSDAGNAELGQIAGVLKMIGGMQATLDEVEAARVAERDRLADEIRDMTEPAASDTPDDPDPDGDPDTPDDPDAPEATADAPAPAEGEPAQQPEPIAASADPRDTPRVRISNVNARRDERRESRAMVTPGEIRVPTVITAAGNIGGFDAGHRFDLDTDQGMTEAISALGDAVKGALGLKPGGGRYYRKVFRLEQEMPDERYLTGDVKADTAKVEAVTGSKQRSVGKRQGPMAAAGGINHPINVRYDQPVIGSTARPVRDALEDFGAQFEGTISTLPPPNLGDAEGGITVWTEANDRLAAPGGASANPATKACLRITVPEAEPTIVDAIVACLELGEFDYRFFRQNAEAWIRLLAVEQARVADNRLLTQIAAGSVDVNIAELLGTTRDMLAGLERAHSIYTYRHRDPDIPFTLIAPVWALNEIRADLIRQMPVGTVDETFALADARIAQWFRMHNTTPYWHLDGLSGQTFAAQGDGAMVGWPDTIQVNFFPAGDWLYLNGGVNDQGVVRDSTLNAVNDLQIWGEIFEAAHHHGHDSWRLIFDVVPDGGAAALQTISIADTGS